MKSVELFDMTGKVAIVTGGSGLYGKYISSSIAEAGANVIIASRNKAACELTARTIVGEGFKAEGMKLDLSQERSIVEFVQNVISKYGKIDVRVNNAVSRKGMKNLEDLSKIDWEEAQVINSTGLMLITRERKSTRLNSSHMAI